MKHLNKAGIFVLCSLLAFPIFIAVLSTGLIITYSDGALLFLLGN